jgi:hypothetical protein
LHLVAIEEPARAQVLQLSTFAETAAALRKGDELEQRDIDIVAELCQYINYRFNAM